MSYITRFNIIIISLFCTSVCIGRTLNNKISKYREAESERDDGENVNVLSLRSIASQQTRKVCVIISHVRHSLHSFFR